MTPEQIIPLALFVIVVLFNLVGRWLRGRMQQQEQQQAPPPPPLRVEPVPLPPRARLVTSRPPAFEERSPVRRAPARVVVREAPRLLGTPRDVRRAIVMMAVLGPPRGLQSDGPDGIR